MDTIALKRSASQVLSQLGIANTKPDWFGCDAVWPALEEMANEGSVVVVKLDGQRTSPEDNGRYTILVSGGQLGEDFFRMDTDVLEEGLSKAILFYADKCWK